jgi:hypothetical protein
VPPASPAKCCAVDRRNQEGDRAWLMLCVSPGRGILMGRDLFLQDDTFLQPLADFRSCDGRLLLDFFLDEPILDAFERILDLDLSAFRQVADDTERWLLSDTMSADALQTELRKLRQQMDEAWQPPASLTTVIDRVLQAIDALGGFPTVLMTTVAQLPIETTIDLAYYKDGELAQDLRDLLAMVHHAEQRSAMRVRLLVR